MSLLQMAKATYNGDYKYRIGAALLIVADEVQKRGYEPGDNRLNMALQIIVNPMNNPHIVRFAALVAARPEIASTLTDSTSAPGTVEVGADDTTLTDAVRAVFDTQGAAG